jgi:hypothetical protein
MRFLLATLLLYLICQAPVDAQSVSITVQRLDDGDWQVDYHLDQPAERLVFLRHFNSFRHQRWQSASGDFELAGGYEWLRAPRPTRHFRLTFATATETLIKDYDLLRLFTDSSAAIYTGHLAAVPMKPNGQQLESAVDQAADDHQINYRLVPGKDQWVVVAGRRSREPVTWRDQTGWGTYVYFGAIQPIASDRVLAIIDPGLPAWAVTRMQGLVPRLFDRYARATGLALGSRPTLLFSFVPSQVGGLQSGGGALPGLVQLNLTGKDWLGELPGATFQLDHLLAHESAHLWNNHKVVNQDGDNWAWLHEGGADAMTHRVLLDLGVIDEQRYAMVIDDQLNDCLNGLGDRSLVAASQGADFGLHYSCGGVIYRLVELATGDLFGFFAELFSRADRSGEYGWQMFSDTLGNRGGRALIAPIETLARRGGDSLVTLNHAANQVGASIKADENGGDLKYLAGLSARAMAHIMGQDCAGRFSFFTEANGFRIAEPPDSCQQLTSPVLITQIGGLDALRQGGAVHDLVVAGCSTDSELTLTTETGRRIDLTCTVPLAPRAPYRRLLTEPPAL